MPCQKKRTTRSRTLELTTTTAREARSTGETRERRRSSASDTSGRAGQRDRSSSTPSRRPRNTRSSCESGGETGACCLAQTRAGICGRRRLDRQRDYVGAPDNRQPQRALLLLLDDLGGGGRRARGRRLVLLALGSAEFFRVGEDEVHVLVECQHLRGKSVIIHVGNTGWGNAPDRSSGGHHSR